MTTTAYRATAQVHASQPAISKLLDAVETTARRAAVPSLRYGLALIMLWFGIPKLFPGGSPAEQIASETVEVLTSGLIVGDTARLMVGTLEIGLGLALMIGRAMPIVLLALVGHMAGTFMPLFIFPELTWHSPFVGSLEGQYILKNVLILTGILVLAGYGLRHNTTAAKPQQLLNLPAHDSLPEIHPKPHSQRIGWWPNAKQTGRSSNSPARFARNVCTSKRSAT